MKIFVTGVGGQLGYDVVRAASARGYETVGSDIAPVYSGIAPLYTGSASAGSGMAAGSATTAAFSDSTASAAASVTYVPLDITSREAVRQTIEHIKPDVIIHCASWTAVDAAEAEENRNKVYAVNADGTRFLAEAARAADAKMIYISTDYVFNGQGERPWEPDDKTYAPLNYYGYTKLEGEKAVAGILDKYYAVRIAWAFGLNGKNFVKTMINAGKTHDEVRVVCDQTGTPTYTRDLARLLVDMAETDKYGYYHATNEGGYISWYDFCCEFYRQYGLSTRVIPVTTAEYGLSVAARPFNSRLNKEKLVAAGFAPLPDWKDAVRRYLAEAKL